MPIGDTNPSRHPEEDHNLRNPSQIGLCLSGGGYRAMVYHLGTLQYLNKVGYLERLNNNGRISSVSGGSITAAVLGMNWTKLRFVDSVAVNLDVLVTDPIIELAGTSLDVSSFLKGALTPRRSAGQQLANNLNDRVFHGATLKDLPDDSEGPRFVINATNLQTGKLFRFSRPFQGDYTIGLWRKPKTRLADAVGASAGFPPVFSPMELEPSGVFDSSTRGANSEDGFVNHHELGDGGIYDNLGLETVWGSYRTVLVSDGGGELSANPDPSNDKLRHSMRVAEVLDHQVRSMRKRQIITGYTTTDPGQSRSGAYWSIRSDVADYGLQNPPTFKPLSDVLPRNVPTRLTKLKPDVIEDLISFGSVICETAMRRWVLPNS